MITQRRTFRVRIETVKIISINDVGISEEFSEKEVKLIVQDKLKKLGVNWDTVHPVSFYNDFEYLYVEGFIY